MKITGLDIVGFRSHRNTRITGLERVNWFLGLNGAGKSSVLDALSYLRLGICRGTDEGGRGAERLLSTDSRGERLVPAFEITLHTTDGTLRRSGPGEGAQSNSQDRINAAMAIGPTPGLRYALEPEPFLMLAPNQQKATIGALVAPVLDQTDVLTAVGQQAFDLVRAAFPTLAVFDGPACDSVEKHFRELRPKLKAKLSTVQGSAPQTTLDAFPAQMRLLTAEQASVHLQEAERQMRQADATRDNAMRIAAVAENASAAALRARDAIPGYQAKLAGVIQELGPLVLAGEEAAPAWTRGFIEDAVRSRTCPGCGRMWPLKTRSEAIAMHEARISKDSDAASRAAVEREAASLREEIQHLQEAAAGLEKAEARVKVEEMKAKEADAQAVVFANMVGTLRAYIAVRTALEAASVDRGDIERELTACERIIRELGPTGLRYRMADMRLGAFQQEINETTAAMGLELRFQNEPFRIMVNGRVAELLSRSERLRVSVALRLAFAKRSQSPFILVDDFDTLDAGNRARMAALLAKAPEDIQIFAGYTPAKEVTAPPRAPGFMYYRVKTDEHGSAVTPL